MWVALKASGTNKQTNKHLKLFDDTRVRWIVYCGRRCKRYWDWRGVVTTIRCDRIRWLINNKAERKYSTTGKECLSIVWDLEQWKTYLIVTKFCIKTDHKPLMWLVTARDPGGRLVRWAYRLQEFNFTMQHVRGRENEIPDALSRPTVDEQLLVEAILVNEVSPNDSIQSPERWWARVHGMVPSSS